METSTENSLFSFSSECFNSSDFEQEVTINFIVESRNLSSKLKKKEHALEEALDSMRYEKYKELAFIITTITITIIIVVVFSFEWHYLSKTVKVKEIE